MAGIAQPDISFIDQYNSTTDVPFEGTPTNLDQAAYWNEYERNLPVQSEPTYQGQQDTMGMYGGEPSVPYTTDVVQPMGFDYNKYSSITPGQEDKVVIDSSFEDQVAWSDWNKEEGRAKFDALPFADRIAHANKKLKKFIGNIPIVLNPVLGTALGTASGLSILNKARLAGAPKAIDTVTKQFKGMYPTREAINGVHAPPLGPHTKGTSLDNAWVEMGDASKKTWSDQKYIQDLMSKQGRIASQRGISSEFGNISVQAQNMKNLMQKAAGKPDYMVDIFKSLDPKAKALIHSGDWVALSRNYPEAFSRFRSAIGKWKGGPMNVATKKVPAREVFMGEVPFADMDLTSLRLTANNLGVGYHKSMDATAVRALLNKAVAKKRNKVTPVGQTLQMFEGPLSK